MHAPYRGCMTISEHLQFSVLAAPLAAIDRRSLSQAWYSALYGAQTSSAAAPAKAAPARTKERRARNPRPHDASTRANRGVAPPRSAPAREGQPQAAAPERRAPRSPLARKIERALLQPKPAAHKTSFALEGGAGRVKVLLRSSGSRVDLIAICPRNARKEVAAALAQARYSLALRGIDLTAGTREEASC